MWVGETPKNISRVFRAAADEDAVLFFDEADAIAMRRSAGAGMPHERESNLVVNVLLRELEQFNGILIFATNLAANFDPAFERRIRAHVLFEMPGVEERVRIWELQVHPRKTPLARDVNFRELAERHTMSGGDIKNAVIKAAAAAAAEDGTDVGKRIHQRHFEQAAKDVLAAKSVMQQSLFDRAESAMPVLGEASQKLEAQWRIILFALFGVSGAALVIALAALLIVLLR
jgi:SpoVK/Ycf46/Vps4 family AAA+-type ATPase